MNAQTTQAAVVDNTVETDTLKEFNRLVSKATVLDYNPAWANGTGYFDGIVNGPDAPQDLHYKLIYTFEDPNGRKALVFPTRHGNVVVFSRYSNRRDVLAANMPQPLSIFFVQSRPLTFDDLTVIGGGWSGSGIGAKIESALAYEERRKKYEVSGADEDHPDLGG